MGADLIGFILVGPETLVVPEPKAQKIVAKAARFVAAAKKAVTDPETGFIDPGSNAYYEESLNKTEKKLLEGREVDELEYVGQMDPEKLDSVLNELLNVWEGGNARDVMSRYAVIGGKSVKIVSTGEMSWGDEPEGYGYTTLKDALATGIAGSLNIY